MSPYFVRGLGDLTWDQLLEEARRLIPSHAPEWTDHNPSDPGITIIELLAYLTEMLGYRIDRLGPAERNSLLALLNGPEWKPGPDFEEDLRASILALRQRYRAVTVADFEALALAANSRLPAAVPDRVARARCIPQRDASARGPLAHARRPGYVSVVLVPRSAGEAPVPLMRAVRNILEPARLLTTRLIVTGARYVPVRVRATLVARFGCIVNPSDAVKAINTFLHPLTGWTDGSGWPFGREVHISEILTVLDEVPGVDYVLESREVRSRPTVNVLSTEPADPERLIRDEAGNVEAIRIHDEELPLAKVEAGDFAVLSSREGELRRPHRGKP